MAIDRIKKTKNQKKKEVVLLFTHPETAGRYRIKECNPGSSKHIN